MKQFLLTGILILYTCLSFAQENEYSWDTITFEEPYSYLSVNQEEGNIWEIGAPAKTIFNAALHGENAILTDLDEPYPANNNSFFEVMLSYENCGYFPFSIYLEVNHRYDTDEGNDGGYIEISRDCGVSWENVMVDRASCMNPSDGYRVENLYADTDLLFNGEPGFSGNSGGWVKTKFGWVECIVKGTEAVYCDTVMFRFHFVSDGTDSGKEGWMIDDIRIFSMDLIGQVEEDGNMDMGIFPNPASGSAEICLPGGEEIASVRLINMGGQEIFVPATQGTVCLEGVGAGIYLLKVETPGKTYMQKLIVQSRK